LYAQLWGLHNTGQTVNGLAGTPGADIKFVGAWSLAQPATGEVVVAVVDTGVDYTHPDIVSNMWTNPNGMDANDGGYVGDYYGYDFIDNVADPMDSGFHGTHVSGIVAATGGNHIGVIGVNFHARIMALKVSNDGSTTPDGAVIEAIQYATMMKGRGNNIAAINASFGGGGYSTVEESAITAAGDAGIVFCAAAGNNSSNNDATAFYPANYRLPNMIVVAASDQNDELASFSNYGATTVDLAAPGVNILSTIPVALVNGTATVVQASATFAGNGLTYAGTTTGITAAVYDCGLGYPGDFPPEVNGNIALIQRGTLYFTNKVGSAMQFGAVAAIIYNNTNGNFLGDLVYPTNWIPAVSISQADGATLESLLPTRVTVINLPNPSNAYEYLDGTSMAAPHVTASVSFLAMQYPGDSVTQRIQRILGNVDSLTNLSAKVATGGRLDLLRSYIGTPEPVISNALTEVDGVLVVLPGQPIQFTAAITDAFTSATTCLWSFGDGTTVNDCGPTHTYTDCGPESGMAVASDGVTPVTNNYALAVACPFSTSPKGLSVKLMVNFAPGKLDSAQITGVIDLPVGFSVNNVSALVEVGAVTVPFTLNAKGDGTSGGNSLKLQRKGKAVGAVQPWQVSATLRGDWKALWVANGLVNATINTTVTLPILLFLDSAAPEAFYTNEMLAYKATAGKSGSAK
jgi:subtilisin family serine protease